MTLAGYWKRMQCVWRVKRMDGAEFMVVTSGSKQNLWRRLEWQWSSVYNGNGDNDSNGDVDGGGSREH